MRALVLAVIALAGCVPSRTEVWHPVDEQVQRRLGVAPVWIDDERTAAAVTALLARPLDVDAAIRIALATNRHLQVSYAELGVAAGGIAAATVLPPTEIDLDYKIELGDGDGSELEVSAIQDVLALVQLGQRRGIARERLAAARSRAIAATIAVAAEVETAFWDVVGAQQTVELRQTGFDAAAAAAEVAERMHAAGNTSDLALARERDQREQTRLELARAQVDVELAREALDAALGVTGDETRWTIEVHLPEVGDAPALDTLEADAVDASLELIALRADLTAASREVGEARLRSWLPTVGVGAAATRRDGAWEVGPAVRLGLPLFDQGQGARARAWAGVHRAQHELTATAVDLRATARAVRQRVLGAHAEARHLRDVVLPLRQTILDETLRHYNAMDASTFELLAARRELADAGRQYIDALRRLAIAQADAAALRRGVTPSTARR